MSGGVAAAAGAARSRPLAAWPVVLALAGLAAVIVTLVLATPAARPMLAGGAFVAAAAGLSATSVGVFGAVLVPGLLLLGVEPSVAVATSLVLQVLVIPVGAGSHAAAGHVRRAITLPLIVGGVIGSTGGGLLASHVPSAIAARVIAVVIVAVGIVVLAALRPGGRRRAGSSIGPSRIGAIGLAAGTASGISGAGWGPIGVKLLILGGVEPKLAIGSSLVGRIPMAMAAIAAYAIGSASRGLPLLDPALVAVLLGACVTTMVPGTLAIGRLGRTPAAATVALLSIALALPTVVGWR